MRNRSRKKINVFNPRETSVLSDDAIFDILSRLPVTSLMRFRCVCNDWNSLTRNPQFVNMHFARAATDVSFQRVLIGCSKSISVDGEENDQVFTFDNPLDWRDNQLSIAGYCNGLLSLADLHHSKYILRNPSAREHKEISKVDAYHYSMVASGLGYDALEDDYKIVRSMGDALVSAPNDVFRKFEVEVMSLGTNSWRRVEDYHSEVDFTYKREYLNGALH